MPLHIACLYGSKLVVRLLLDNNSTMVNKTTNKGNTALHLTLSRPRYHEHNPYYGGSEDERLEIAQLLVSKGAKHDARNGLGMRPIHFAAKFGLQGPLVYLLSLNEDVNTVDNRLRTPLHYAAAGGFEACVTILREMGANAKKQDSQGCTPLHLAAMHGYVTVVEALIKGSDTEFVNTADTSGNTALHYAARGKHAKTVRAILVRGGVPTLTNSKTQTPLHLACASHSTSQPSTASEDCVHALLESSNVVINAEDNTGLTPLDYAIMAPHTHCLAPLLLSKGSTVSNKDSQSNYAIHRAAAGGCIKCTALVMDKGSRAELAGHKERLAIHYAAANGRVGTLEMFLDANVSVVARSVTKLTPLHFAARYGHDRCVSILLDRGAEIDARCAQEWTPLHHACAMGHKTVVALLIEHGAEVNSVDKRGRTPLHKATYYGHPECVLMLVERGAQVNQGDASGENPVQWAAIRGLTSALVFMSALGM